MSSLPSVTERQCQLLSVFFLGFFNSMTISGCIFFLHLKQFMILRLMPMDRMDQIKDKPVIHYYEKEYLYSYLKRGMQFLAKYSWIYNFKNTDIFNEEALQNIPCEWKEPLLNLSCTDLNQVPYGLIKDEWPLSLKKLIEEAVSYHVSSHFDLKEEAFHFKLEIPNFIQKKMSEKKLMEVKHMSTLISHICQKFHCGVVLDIGSGLGYLDQVLHHNFGLTVIGLDSVAARTHSAEIRIQEGTCDKNVHHSTCMVDSSSNCVHHLKSLLNEVLQKRVLCMCGTLNKADFESKALDEGIIMVGLHSCGNLVHHMMKLFMQLPEVKAFLCVGCCYHRMPASDFPVSNTAMAALSSTKCSYPDWSPSVFGFRLGSQDTRAQWESRSADDHIIHSKNVIYRGVFQCFLQEENLTWRRPRRHFAKLTTASTFEDYTSLILENMKFSDSEKEEKTKHLHDMFVSKQHLFPSVRIIALLQVLLQPVWEGVITIDRVAFLIENNFDAKIIFMCNELTTPRNLAIFGIR